MKRYEYFANLQREAERAKERTRRRYLRDVSAALPCGPRRKREILRGLREMLECDGAPESRAELEAEIGTPESLAALYVGEDALPILRRTTRRKRIILTVVLVLLAVQTVVLTAMLLFPMGHYEEHIESLDNGFGFDEVTFNLEPEIAHIRSAKKTATYFDSRGARVWSITVYGTFGYTYGSKSKATEIYTEITLYNPDAALCSEDGYAAGNMAYATATVRCGDLLLSRNVSLTCDAYGRLH